MNDSFAFLMNSGIPLEQIQRYQAENIPLDEVARAVQSMQERGLSIDAILQEDGKPQEAPAEVLPTLEIISAHTLQQKDIPPIRWIVKDLLPAGLSILASPPKFGKSWAAMQLCLSVAIGGRFLGYQCHKTGCLHLALEDGERRLKSRMGKILGPVPAPLGFDFTTEAPSLGTGLIDALEGYIRGHPDTGLVVVDTLQKVRDLGGGRDVYGKDYSDIGALKKFADAHNVAVVLIHHLRKMKDDGDPFNMISGTTGVSGAADTMFVLTKEKRGDETAKLNITGRDVEMMELVLKFNKSTCLWENMGDADAFAEQQARLEYQDSPIVKTIKKLVDQSPEGWTGTAQQLLDAGRFVARASLADSTRALTNKLKELDKLLMEYDSIVHERKGNGSGGGRHKFYYVDAPQFEEIEQSEINPFSEG